MLNSEHIFILLSALLFSSISLFVLRRTQHSFCYFHRQPCPHSQSSPSTRDVRRVQSLTQRTIAAVSTLPVNSSACYINIACLIFGQLCPGFCGDFSHFHAKQTTSTRKNCELWDAINKYLYLNGLNNTTLLSHTNETLESVLARFGTERLVSKTERIAYLRGRKLSDDEDVICTASGCLEQQEKLFWHKRLCALKKRWTKCISTTGNYSLC